jgi:hypothetical protein
VNATAQIGDLVLGEKKIDDYKLEGSDIHYIDVPNPQWTILIKELGIKGL